MQFVGQATGTNTATLPAHQAGDLIVAFAYRDGSTTAPSQPAGWATVDFGGSNTNSSRLAWKRAASSSETAGTWTNATGVVFLVYRADTGQTINVGNNGAIGGSSTTITYPALTIAGTTGGSRVVAFAGHRSVNTALETPPSGTVARANRVDTVCEVAAFDTNGVVDTWTQRTVSVGGTASGYQVRLLEITETPTTVGQTFSDNYPVYSAVGRTFSDNYTVTGASVALVQATPPLRTADSGGGATLAFPADVTAGNALILVVANYPSGISSVTDTGGNVWQQAVAAGDYSNNFVEVWFAESAAGGPTTLTITPASANSNYITARAMEWTGLVATGLLDAGASATALDSLSVTSGSPAQAGELVVTAAVADFGDANLGFGVPADFTLLDRENDSNTYTGLQAAYRVDFTGGPVTATHTASFSGSWFDTVLAAFRANIASGGGATVNGAALSAAATLGTEGAAAGSAPPGAALSVSVAFAAGEVAAGVSADGIGLTALSSFSGGAVDAGAVVAGAGGATATTLDAGIVTAGAGVGGASWVVGISLQAGSAGSATFVDGAVFVLDAQMQTGAASGGAHIAGAAFGGGTTFTVGAVSAGADVGGEELPTSAALATGAVAAGAGLDGAARTGVAGLAAGEVAAGSVAPGAAIVAASIVFAPGAATAGAAATGAVWPAGVVLQPGAAGAGASINGVAFVGGVLLLPGAAAGGWQVVGAAFASGAAVASGSVSAGADVAGAALSVAAGWAPGVVTGGESATVAGAALSAGLSLAAGGVNAGATAAGVAVTRGAALSVGSVLAGAEVGGIAPEAVASLQPGAVTGATGAFVAGAVWVAPVTAAGGAVTAGTTRPGVSLTRIVSLSRGGVSAGASLVGADLLADAWVAPGAVGGGTGATVPGVDLSTAWAALAPGALEASATLSGAAFGMSVGLASGHAGAGVALAGSAIVVGQLFVPGEVTATSWTVLPAPPTRTLEVRVRDNRIYAPPMPPQAPTDFEVQRHVDEPRTLAVKPKENRVWKLR